MENENLVINWHITEKCNYNCKFCFAKWNKDKEVWDDFESAKAILDNLKQFWKSGYRLNFVGGEPLLFADRIIPIMKYAIELGMDLSVQTNGTRLETLVPVIKHISQIGISIDSWDNETNCRIGRCRGNTTLSLDDLKSKLDLLRRNGGNFKLKINTVVSEWNWNSKVIPQMEELGTNRIKILRQMPFGSAKGITEKQFYTFIYNNCISELPIYIEDNELMTESYLMIAPNGSLFQNGTGDEYAYSDSLLETPISIAMKQINFDLTKFGRRYRTDSTNMILDKVFGRNAV